MALKNLRGYSMDKVYFIILLAILSFIGCSKENSNSTQNEQSSIIYKEVPCHGEGLAKDNSEETVKLSWSLNNSKLNILLKYMVTCGSAFKDSTTYSGNILSINVKDTSSQHAKCICEHGAQVEMNIGSEKQIRIMFSTMGYSQHKYSLELDTLLVIR
jgi:hypothetical protein